MTEARRLDQASAGLRHQCPVAVYIPCGVRLTSYSGGAGDLPAGVLQSFLDEIASGRLDFPIAGVFSREQVAEAHQVMERGAAAGKLVVVVE